MKRKITIITIAFFVLFALISTMVFGAFADEKLPELEIYGRTVFLDSNFGVRYLIKENDYYDFCQKYGIPEISYSLTKNGADTEEDETSVITPSVNRKVQSLELCEFDSKMYYSFRVEGIAPKDLATKINIVITYDGKTLDNYTDSVLDAMQDVTSGTYPEYFKNLAKSILEYGQAAAGYFGKETSFTDTDTEFVGLDKFDIVEYREIESSPVTIIGTSLILKDRLSVRFWIDAGSYNMENAKVCINNNFTDAYPVLKNTGSAGYYVLEYSCYAANMKDTILLYFTNEDGQAVSNVYEESIASYCAYVINNSALYEKLCPLAKKILNYIYYTDLYFEGATPTPPQTSGYSVTFKDWDGKVIKEVEVDEGESATPPSDPVREGYTFIGWDGNYSNVTKNECVVAQYTENVALPKITVSNANATAGATKVTVVVSLENNPGFLTMALNMAFNSDVLTLTKVSTGIDFIDYNFTAPKNKTSGCTAAWFASDLPEEIIDGDIMTLQFTVASNAPKGQYPITISCPNDGSTVDGNKQAFTMANAVGYITVN